MQPAIHVCRASKGSEAIAPVLLAKERNGRIIGADDELWAWIEWRIERATKAEQLRKVGVPLFPNWRARRHLNPDRRCSQCSIHWEWKAACAVVGVEGVSVYPGTKHTTATDLIRRGRSRGAVQKLLGHADPRSTDAYVQLSDDDTINMIRRRKD